MGQSSLSLVYGGTAQCGRCEHYHRYDWHSRLGKCGANQPKPPAGLWDTDWRQCAWEKTEECRNSPTRPA